jgi:hypothetical protein
MDYISVCKWPLAALVFGLVLLWRFEPEIRELLRRGFKLSRGNYSFEAPPAQFQDGTQQPPAANDISKAFTEAMRVFDSPAVREVEDAIRKDLRERGLGEPSAEAVNVLLRSYAYAYLGRYFEHISGLIWGSQLRLLHHLNAAPLTGGTADELRPFHATAAEHFPDYSFEQYLGFLIGYRLVALEGDRYQITPLGREFLIFRIQSGRTEWRSY